jgi:hypothetical protein
MKEIVNIYLRLGEDLGLGFASAVILYLLACSVRSTLRLRRRYENRGR